MIRSYLVFIMHICPCLVVNKLHTRATSPRHILHKHIAIEAIGRTQVIRVGVTARRRDTSSSATTAASSSASSSAATATSTRIWTNPGRIIGIKLRPHSSTTDGRHAWIVAIATTTAAVNSKIETIIVNARSTKGGMVGTHQTASIILLTKPAARIEDAAGGQIPAKVPARTTPETRIQICNARIPSWLRYWYARRHRLRWLHRRDCRSAWDWNLTQIHSMVRFTTGLLLDQLHPHHAGTGSSLLGRIMDSTQIEAGNELGHQSCQIAVVQHGTDRNVNIWIIAAAADAQSIPFGGNGRGKSR
mmetsp:Transcript_9431/g.21053  ORF Transcript_9431/g.21053 Transcript_9431/m.21053 type:complete len:303 (-) Transcript_9431:1258-2166(-)